MEERTEVSGVSFPAGSKEVEAHKGENSKAARQMIRTEIINTLIEKRGFTRYLEIGLRKSVNFDAVRCPYKISVDPDPTCRAVFKMTSDKYFSLISTWDVKYDCCFIDGLHQSDQVERDINNALRHLADNGAIVCHDCSPINEIEQRVPRETKRWNGDVWKAIVKLRQRHDLTIHTVDTDEGCAIIEKKPNHLPLRVTRELTYENLEAHRQIWLNLISVNEFKRLFT
jgi:hypothetical protein